MMAITLLAFLFPLMLLFTVDADTFLVTSLYLYGLVLCYRFARRQPAFLDALFFVTLAFLSVMQLGVGIQRVIPYTGTVIYGMLSLAFLWGALKKPFSLSAENAWKPEKLAASRLGSLLLFLFNILAFVCSIVLFPSIAYIFVPLFLTAISIPLSIFFPDYILDTVAEILARAYSGEDDRRAVKEAFGNLRGMALVNGNLVAKEVCTDRERQLFFEVIEHGYTTLYQRDTSHDKPDYATFINRIKDEFRNTALQATAFVVRDTRRNIPVGCIRIVHRGKKPLPMELYVPIALGDLARRAGSIAEVGRFVMLPGNIQKGSILEMLILLMIVKVLRSGIRIILTDAMKDSVAIYQKLGMQLEAGPYMDKEFSQESWVCAADVAALLIQPRSQVWERAKQSALAKKTIRRYLEFIQDDIRKRQRSGRPNLKINDPLKLNLKGVSG